MLFFSKNCIKGLKHRLSDYTLTLTPEKYFQYLKFKLLTEYLTFFYISINVSQHANY